MSNFSKVSFWVNKEFDLYPTHGPFHPHEAFPEYKGDLSDEKNDVYGAVRNSFRLLDLDIKNFNTPRWNPLGKIIKPGDTVLIKPNFVFHKNMGQGSLWSVITHPSVIRVVIDYVYIALCKKGKIIIADAPQADANWDEILEKTNLASIVQYYRDKYDFNIDVYDLRQLRFEYKEGILLSDSRTQLQGDPNGYTVFNLENNSYFNDIENLEKIYGADYDRKETIYHHCDGKHEYCISNSILESNVIISIPKMKMHRKAGITLNYKNIIGINGNKNYLPHFRIGVPTDGGDEFERLNDKEKTVKYINRFLIDILLIKPNRFKSYIYTLILQAYRFCKKFNAKNCATKKNTSGGSWYGNDTLWRTILDLNLILEYGNANGQIAEILQRKLFSVIDGGIAGEGNGPLSPVDKKCGMIAVGEDYLLTDLVVAQLMGVDYRKVKVYKELIERNPQLQSKINNLQVMNNMNYKFSLNQTSSYFDFQEPDGWKDNLRII